MIEIKGDVIPLSEMFNYVLGVYVALRELCLFLGKYYYWDFRRKEVKRK